MNETVTDIRGAETIRAAEGQSPIIDGAVVNHIPGDQYRLTLFIHYPVERDGIVNFDWAEVGSDRTAIEAAAKKWFTDEGLTPPANIEVDTLTSQGAGDDPDGLLTTAVEGMVYQLDTPYQEVNPGHPIEFDGRTGEVRPSSPAKSLGKPVFDALIAAGVARFKKDTTPAVRPSGVTPLTADESSFNILSGKDASFTNAEKELFGNIVSLCDDVFTVQSDDNQQAEVLYNLATWIRLMGYTAAKAVYDRAANDLLYCRDFKGLLLQMRLVNPETFFNRFKWVLNRSYDFFSEDLPEARTICLTPAYCAQ